MRIVSCRRGGVTSVDLHAGAWRLALAATATTAGAGVGLVWRWPSQTAAALAVVPGSVFIPMNDVHHWAIAVAEVTIAKEVKDLAPVTTVALENGSEEADLQRTTEAMSMFRNLPRFREDALRSDTESVLALVRAFWQIARWAMSAQPERFELAVGDATLVGIP